MNHLAKSTAQAVASWIGCEINPKWKVPQLSLRNHLLGVFESYSIQCVLDVGANEGQYHDFLREQVGYQGSILSFEPNVACYEKILKRSKSDNSTV
jgi:hypothetical protein